MLCNLSASLRNMESACTGISLNKVADDHDFIFGNGGLQ